MVHTVGNDVSDCRAETFLLRRIIERIGPKFVLGIVTLHLLKRHHFLFADLVRVIRQQHAAVEVTSALQAIQRDAFRPPNDRLIARERLLDSQPTNQSIKQQFQRALRRPKPDDGRQVFAQRDEADAILSAAWLFAGWQYNRSRTRRFGFQSSNPLP